MCKHPFPIQFSSLLVAIVLTAIVLAPARGASRTEDFAADPGWEAVNNRIPPEQIKSVVQDFGYSQTHYAGGESSGEIGGKITRSLIKASYAKKIPATSLQNKLSASGKFAVTQADGGSALMFGWFNSESEGWRTPNSLAFRLDGNGDKYWVFFEYGTSQYATGGGETFEGDRYQTTPTPPEKADGTVHEWALTYDPTGAGGKGEITFVFDGESFTCEFAEGHKEQGATFDRFGIFNQMTSGNSMQVYFDDVKVGGESFDFSSDPGWVETGNRGTFRDDAVRPFHDIGYSETSYAGGEKGEMGGIVWRIDPANPEHSGYYGDPVGSLNLDTPLAASGKVSMVQAGADSAALIGWFNSQTFREGSVPRNFVGIMIEGPSRIGHYFRPAYANSKDRVDCTGQGPTLRPDKKSHDWTLTYDPEGNHGNGTIQVTLDGTPVAVNLHPDTRKEGAEFDRFGLVPFLQGGHHVRAYFDDLTYTVGAEQ